MTCPRRNEVRTPASYSGCKRRVASRRRPQAQAERLSLGTEPARGVPAHVVLVETGGRLGWHPRGSHQPASLEKQAHPRLRALADSIEAIFLLFPSCSARTCGRATLQFCCVNPVRESSLDSSTTRSISSGSSRTRRAAAGPRVFCTASFVYQADPTLPVTAAQSGRVIRAFFVWMRWGQQ